MLNAAPYEVLAAPFTLYTAPVGTTFPAVSATPDPALWTKVGSSGPLNYDRAAGVNIEHRQNVTIWRSAGDPGPGKTFRVEEDQLVRITLVDITLEQYSNALNHNEVTTGSGTKTIGLSRGTNIITKALLLRGSVSPYQEEGAMQYEVPRAQQTASQVVPLSIPGQPASLALEFTSLVDPTAASEDQRFGRIVAEDDTATT